MCLERKHERYVFAGRLKWSWIYFDKILQFRSLSFLTEKIDDSNKQLLVENFDLLIDCTGKKGPFFPFPVVEELSPFQAPPRKQVTGYFFGISPFERIVHNRKPRKPPVLILE